MSKSENRPMKSDRSSVWKKAVVSIAILFASVAAAALICAVFGLIYEKVSPSVPTPLHTIDLSDTGEKMNPETIIQSEAVRNADAALQKAVEETVNELHLFFESARANSPVFAEQVLGMGSKVRLVSDKLPFTRDDRFEKYMQQCFRETIFSEETLAQTVESALARFETQVQGIEKEMLVNLAETFPEIFSDAAGKTYGGGSKLNNRYSEALNEVVVKNRGHVSRSIQVDVAGEFAGSILGFIGSKLLVSAGILTAGASGSVYTCGASLIASIIGDLLVSWAWDWYADPQGEIAASVNEQLDQIEALLVDGNEGQPGFRKAVTERIEYYTQCRNEAFVQMVR